MTLGGGGTIIKFGQSTGQIDCGNNSCVLNNIEATTKLTSPLLDGVAPDRTVSIASSQTTGSLIIGNSSTRTGTIYISNASPSAHSIIIGNETANAQTLNIASKTINLGNSTVASTVSTKVPITIGYTVNPSSINQIGGSLTSSANNVSVGFTSAISLSREYSNYFIISVIQ